MSTQGLHAEGLCGVVPGGDIVDAILRGLVHHPFGRLAGDIGVEAGCDCLVVFAFGRTGDDTH